MQSPSANSVVCLLLVAVRGASAVAGGAVCGLHKKTVDLRYAPYPIQSLLTSAAMLVLYPTRYSDQAGRAPFSGEVLAGRTCMLGDLVPQPEDC
jgi:hypothetical protein